MYIMNKEERVDLFMKELHELFNKHNIVIDVFSDFNGHLYDKSTNTLLGTLYGECELDER